MNEEMKELRVVRIESKPSAHQWICHTQSAVYAIPSCTLWRRLSSAALSALNAFTPRNAFPNAFKTSCEHTIQIVSLCQSLQPVIYSDFPLDLTGFFYGKNLIKFLANKMQDFWNFVLHNCILNFYAEQVYLNLKSQMSRIRKLQQTLHPTP